MRTSAEGVYATRSMDSSERFGHLTSTRVLNAYEEELGSHLVGWGLVHALTSSLRD